MFVGRAWRPQLLCLWPGLVSFGLTADCWSHESGQTSLVTCAARSKLHVVASKVKWRCRCMFDDRPSPCGGFRFILVFGGAGRAHRRGAGSAPSEACGPASCWFVGPLPCRVCCVCAWSLGMFPFGIVESCWSSVAVSLSPNNIYIYIYIYLYVYIYV
jgi:hypothetical protein